MNLNLRDCSAPLAGVVVDASDLELDHAVGQVVRESFSVVRTDAEEEVLFEQVDALPLRPACLARADVVGHEAVCAGHRVVVGVHWFFRALHELGDDHRLRRWWHGRPLWLGQEQVFVLLFQEAVCCQLLVRRVGAGESLVVLVVDLADLPERFQCYFFLQRRPCLACFESKTVARRRIDQLVDFDVVVLTGDGFCWRLALRFPLFHFLAETVVPHDLLHQVVVFYLEFLDAQTEIGRCVSLFVQFCFHVLES